MENYILDGAAVLSKDDIAGTENLIATAIETLPQSSVAQIMPVTKARGPASKWVEPYFSDDKIELVARDVIMDDDNSQKRLSFSCVAADDLRKMYTNDAFVKLIQSWILMRKHKRQRDQLIELLQGPEVQAIPFSSVGPSVQNITEDKLEQIKSNIISAIHSLNKRFQLDKIDFSVVGPYEISYAVLEIQNIIKDRLHFMGDDRLDSIYVFPTGTTGMSRAGFAIFDYADTIQKTYDSNSGEEVFFVYNRSKVALNPINIKEPIIEKISLT